MVKVKEIKKEDRRSRSQRRGADQSLSGPGDGIVRYTGPIVSPIRKKGLSTRLELLTDSVPASATAGGLYQTVFSSDPTTMTQWVVASGNSDSYRVLGMQLKFCPINRNNQTLAVAYGAGVTIMYNVIDYNSVVQLTSRQVAVEFEGCEYHSLFDEWMREAKAADLNHLEWVDTNTAPANLFSIKTYSTGNFASIGLGDFIVKRLVQFRAMV